MKYIKLSQWAKENNLSYATAWNYFKKGLVKGRQLPTGTIQVFANQNIEAGDK